MLASSSSFLHTSDIENSKVFHIFQVSVWLNERNVVALDENWREPTNLQAKLLKHQSFEAEVLANRYRVDSLTKVGASFFFRVTASLCERTRDLLSRKPGSCCQSVPQPKRRLDLALKN